MAELQTEHRGYTIRYSENDDLWRCYDAQVEAPTLSKARAKIDALHRELRKAAAVECIWIATAHHSDSTVAKCEAKIIDYKGPEMSSRWLSSKPVEVVDHRVSVMAKRRGASRAVRSIEKLSSFAPVSPEAREAIIKADAALLKRQQAQKELEAAMKAIPRLTVDDISDLIAASEAKLTEGKADE